MFELNFRITSIDSMKYPHEQNIFNVAELRRSHYP